MTSSSDILRSSFEDLPNKAPYGFWLAPSGNHFALVGFQQHADVAENLMRQHSSYFKEPNEKMLDEFRKKYRLRLRFNWNKCGTYAKMFFNKWVRVTCEPDEDEKMRDVEYFSDAMYYSINVMHLDVLTDFKNNPMYIVLREWPNWSKLKDIPMTKATPNFKQMKWLNDIKEFYGYKRLVQD